MERKTHDAFTLTHTHTHARRWLPGVTLKSSNIQHSTGFTQPHSHTKYFAIYWPRKYTLLYIVVVTCLRPCVTPFGQSWRWDGETRWGLEEGRKDINNQIKATICAINLQYCLLQAVAAAAGRGKPCEPGWHCESPVTFYVLVSAEASTWDKSLSLGLCNQSSQ